TSRQSGRLHSAMARGCETCVTGMFMAHLPAAHRAAAAGLLEEAPGAYRPSTRNYAAALRLKSLAQI
ncbi:MAG TPA: hypothetical protein VE667_04025, partial [Xanthobacteraceae bacterium]|nr:hypothetical protein [Xanthobacteraceae bacterium]